MRLHISSLEELVSAVREHEIISFDVFDTLIMRKTLYPEDVFEIMQDRLTGQPAAAGFVQNRKRAVLENEIPNPDIYQIYDKFAELAGISDTDKNDVLALELKVERKVLITRDSVADILGLAKRMGKKVYLITDMYLPSEIIVSILTELGICGYDDILVSCDYRTLKSEELFDRFLEKYPGGSYLHIGDNPYSDSECAEKRGMDSVLLDSALTMFRKSVYAAAEEAALDVDDRNMLGMFAAVLFREPFGRDKDQKTGFMDMARLFVSPLVYCMLADIRQTVLADIYDGVLFASRDGYLLKDLYDMMCDGRLPAGTYFYTSRKAAVTACLDDDNRIFWLAGLPFDYDKSELFSRVFLLEGREYHASEGFEQNIAKAADEIKSRSLQLRENYKKYIRSLGITGGKYLFVDLVSSGTCQMYLEQFMDAEIVGYYLCKLKTKEEEKERLKCCSLYQKVQAGSCGYGLYQIYKIIECILTSEEPSLECFDEKGYPVFAEETRNQHEIALLRDMHREIKDYFRDMMYMCGGQAVSQLLIDKLICLFLDADRMDIHVTLRDDWMNRLTRLDFDRDMKGEGGA